MKTNRKYYALDDIGFLGIPNQKHTEKYFSEIGMVIANIKKKQRKRSTLSTVLTKNRISTLRA